MITESTRLNEMPLALLKCLEQDLEIAYKHWNSLPHRPVSSTLMVLKAVTKAIEYQEFESKRLPIGG